MCFVRFMGGDMLEIVCLLYEKVQKRNRKLFLHNVLLVIVGLKIPSFPKMENLCSTYVSVSSGGVCGWWWVVNRFGALFDRASKFTIF